MSQRRVLITGAGSGLGRALAERYAAAGCAIACADIHAGRAAETVAALPGQGHLALAVDVGDDDSFQAMHAALSERWPGAVDVLINNAGIASGGPLIGTDMGEWHRLININVLSVVRGCQAFLPAMLAAGHGQIINTASFAGLAGAPNIMTYGVSKAAVVTLSEQLRAELHGRGIAVSVVCPAFFKTNLLESWQGNARMKPFAEKMMTTSPDTLDTVADAVFAAAERQQFLIIPTRNEPMRWRIKRWFPQWYFRMLIKATRSATK
ncbi:MAG: short chain dehydrogenase [Gammaproteobacteria bacterium HGW-Gammaproteobacteria-2]|jgi:NADP-dependent 3-hydroxy acid dehydrogenase YdfG|nr:MAG: short chain dehydrogenase [Gammaproteobacteria bacterium HGW-Gammaproteobacteria-2]